ncbi:hypothetical protein BH09BAC5_BH09BAC5_05210 [soil metagenome]
MENKLFYKSVNPYLLEVLHILMEADCLEKFRLIGGTALSLHRGHRESVDIDLFTDAEYGSVDFEAINSLIRKTFPYFDTNDYKEVGMGRSYYVGKSKSDCIKIDLFYTDKYIQDFLDVDGIRLASIGEIIAMKMDVVSRGGRKKDFWDIHELKDEYSFNEMLALHEKRYPYTHDEKIIENNFTNFISADEDFDPICLRGKHWEIIKLDLIDFAKK